MRLVVVESPYSASGGAKSVEKNLRYARECMLDCLRRRESPYASHALLTQPGMLNDLDPNDRALGLHAGYAWAERADRIAFYLDLGMSGGMRATFTRYRAKGLALRVRWLGAPWSDHPAGDASAEGFSI